MARIFVIQFLIVCISLNSARGELLPDACGSMNGVRIGGQCFFTENSRVNQPNAWRMCFKYNATLAQIHTTKEFTAISAMLAKSNTKAWIALGHELSTKGDCSFPPALTFWNDALNAVNFNLRGDKTWIRSLACNDTYSGFADEFCGLLSSSTLIDESCSASWFSLCQITDVEQTYIFNSGKCLLESPVETVKATYEIQECADVCSTRHWCRSYEYDDDGSECRLYSWSLIDNTCTGNGCAAFTTNATADCCYHYDSDLGGTAPDGAAVGWIMAPLGG